MKKLMLSALIIMLAGCASAPPQNPLQPTAHPSQLGHALRNLQNPQRPFAVAVTPRGSSNTVRIGERVNFDLSTSINGFANLYIFQKAGDVVALAENMPIRGGIITPFPPANSPFELATSSPAGTDTVLLLVTKQKIGGTIYHDAREMLTPKPIIAPREGAIRAIERELQNMPASDWNSAILDMNVLP